MIKLLKKTKYWIIALAIAFTSGTFVAFDDNTNFEIAKNLDIYYTLFRELNLYYVDETKPGELIQESIDAMLNSLDPYTVFIPESQLEDFQFMTTGQYGGIGAMFRKSNNRVVIDEPYEGSPAQKGGLQAGDELIAVDGKLVSDFSLSEISEMLQGQQKTKVKVTIRKPGKTETIDFELEREEIKISNVPFSGMLKPGVGYINLSSFTMNAYGEVRKALTELKQNNELKAIILDLRGNPGGLLIEAVNISNLFVQKGELIVSTRGRVSEWYKDYRAAFSPVDEQIPVFVLVNSGSASASEIVAGAMQDLDRGVIIGQRTYGKGLVQTTRPLSYNTNLKITTAKYYTPSGRCIQALDYTHRNPDGSVGKVPDSLITEYKTRNGRIVYDGGGIQPDVFIPAETLSNIAYSLLEKELIFDFATQYYYSHPPVLKATDFFVTDDLYQEFITFLSGKEYDYKTQSEEDLNLLIKSVKEEKYYDLAAAEIEALKKKIAHDQNKDLQVFKEEIKRLIAEEIVSRYFYQKGRMEVILRDDPAIKSVLELIDNPQEYKRILTSGSPGK